MDETMSENQDGSPFPTWQECVESFKETNALIDLSHHVAIWVGVAIVIGVIVYTAYLAWIGGKSGLPNQTWRIVAMFLVAGFLFVMLPNLGKVNFSSDSQNATAGVEAVPRVVAQQVCRSIVEIPITQAILNGLQSDVKRLQEQLNTPNVNDDIEETLLGGKVIPIFYRQLQLPLAQEISEALSKAGAYVSITQTDLGEVINQQPPGTARIVYSHTIGRAEVDEVRKIVGGVVSTVVSDGPFELRSGKIQIQLF